MLRSSHTGLHSCRETRAPATQQRGTALRWLGRPSAHSAARLTIVNPRELRATGTRSHRHVALVAENQEGHLSQKVVRDERVCTSEARAIQQNTRRYRGTLRHVTGLCASTENIPGLQKSAFVGRVHDEHDCVCGLVVLVPYRPQLSLHNASEPVVQLVERTVVGVCRWGTHRVAEGVRERDSSVRLQQ
jgi:hypothetical protein